MSNGWDDIPMPRAPVRKVEQRQVSQSRAPAPSRQEQPRQEIRIISTNTDNGLTFNVETTWPQRQRYYDVRPNNLKSMYFENHIEMPRSVANMISNFVKQQQNDELCERAQRKKKASGPSKLDEDALDEDQIYEVEIKRQTNTKPPLWTVNLIYPFNKQKLQHNVDPEMLYQMYDEANQKIPSSIRAIVEEYRARNYEFEVDTTRETDFGFA